MGCSKQSEEAVSPKLLGYYPSDYWYVLIDSKTGKELVNSESLLVNLRIYFFESGKKIYNQPLSGGAIEYQFPEMKPRWFDLSDTKCITDKPMPYKGALIDTKCLRLCYDKDIHDFYVEWEGKTLGKMTISTKVVTIANPPPAEGVLGYQTQFVRLDQLKFNDVVVELDQDTCPAVHKLKVNL